MSSSYNTPCSNHKLVLSIYSNTETSFAMPCGHGALRYGAASSSLAMSVPTILMVSRFGRPFLGTSSQAPYWALPWIQLADLVPFGNFLDLPQWTPLGCIPKNLQWGMAILSSLQYGWLTGQPSGPQHNQIAPAYSEPIGLVAVDRTSSSFTSISKISISLGPMFPLIFFSVR